MRNWIAAFAAVLALACPAFATVTGNPPPASYTCNGTTTAYVTGFPYLATSHLVVTVTTAGVVSTLAITTDYTVSPSLAPSTGTVTLVAGSRCPSGSTLTVSRSVPLTQPQSFRTGSYSGPAHEQAFDRAGMQIQQNAATHAADKTTQAAKDAAQDLSISGISGSVAALNSGSHAVTDASSVLAFGSTTPRSLTTRFGEFINVKDFGAKGDNATNDSAAFQAAVNAAQTTKGRVYIPAGTYILNSAISVAPSAFGIVVAGEGQSGVTLKAGAAMTAVFQFTDASANGSFAFRDFIIDGAHLAQKGIASTQIRYLYLDRVLVKNTTVAAVDVAEGWDQNITASQFGPNDGDGLRLGTNANNVRIEGTVAASNGGWGITVITGIGLSIRNCDIEANALGGIYVAAGSGTAGAGTVNITDSYFEGNATSYISATLTSGSPTITTTTAAVAVAAANVGHVITGPSIPAGTTISSASGTSITLSANATASVTETDYIVVGITISAQVIKADILLNGSVDPTVLAQTFPISNANIVGNTTTSHGATQFVAYANSAVVSLRLSGNTHTTAYSNTSQLPFASLLTGGGLTAMVLEGNVGFSGRNNNGQHFHDRTSVSCSTGTAIIDTAIAEEFIITPPTTLACTVSIPANVFWTTTRPSYQYITVRVRNALGGGGVLGAFTWTGGAGGYRLSAWTNPADGFTRSITFSWDLLSNAWVEVSRTPADVPN